MPNYRFTVLIRQAFSKCYVENIILRFIFKGFIPDNEEGQNIYKYILFSVLQFLNLWLYSWSRVLFGKLGQTPNITSQKSLFKEIGTLYFILGGFRKKTTLSLHFKRRSSGKWMPIFTRLMVVMLHSCWYVCKPRFFF